MTGTNREALVLEGFLDAFNARDLDATMAFFADDCVLDMPRGCDLFEFDGGKIRVKNSFWKIAEP